MPDYSQNEECEYRQRALCALRDSGDPSTFERCANCPGRNRTPIAHQRCWPERAFANLEAEKKKIFDPTKQDEDEASSLEAKLDGMSLADSLSSMGISGGDGPASGSSPRRCYSRLTTPRPPASTPRIEAETPADAQVVTNKRKGELLLSPRNHIGPVRFEGSTSYSNDVPGHLRHSEAQKSLTTEQALCKCVENEDVALWIKNIKPLKSFEESPGTDYMFVERSLDVCSDDVPASLNSLMLSSDTCPLEDNRLGRVSSFQIYSPGFLMNTGSQGGVGSSRDGLYNSKDPEEIADMDTEFPVEDGQ